VLALYEAWNELNTESRERETLVASPVTKSVGVMWDATLDRLVLLLMSTLDAPGHGGSIHRSNRVSFPVFRALLDEPGVVEMLVRDGGSLKRATPREARMHAVIAAADNLRNRLDRLRAETPNRCTRLRQIRDRYLAHELHLETPVDPPIHQNLRSMTDEVLALADDATRVLAPTTMISWPRGEVAGQTKALIKTISQRYPLRG
jgi:hypothetical protein